MKRPALQNKQVGALRMDFRAQKVFGTFEKRAWGPIWLAIIFRDLYSKLRYYRKLMGQGQIRDIETSSFVRVIVVIPYGENGPGTTEKQGTRQ